MEAIPIFQIIIAHRALINGPNKTMENSLESIKMAIDKGFTVEIDLWIVDGEWWLGHDAPQYKTSLDFILSIKDFAYFHAKNIDALDYLLKLKDKLKCFWHQEDSYTITSNGLIWVYPGKPLPNGSIAVMPERTKENRNIHNCYAICTDFAEIYYIYNEMKQRQAKALLIQGTIHDPMIESFLDDSRRCIAIFSYFKDFSSTIDFTTMLEEAKILFPKQNVYSVDWNSANSVIHFTFGQLIGFDAYIQDIDYWKQNEEKYVKTIGEVIEDFLPLKIMFRGLIAIQTGIVMVGYPSIDLNIVRKKLEQKLAESQLAYRKYTNNIFHSTVLRLCKTVTPDTLLKFANKHGSTFFGELTVHQLSLAHCSWRMQLKEIHIIQTFSCKNI